MKTPTSNNPYADCNSWLFHYLQGRSTWTDKDFANVIEHLKALPFPNTKVNNENLLRSRLGETLPNLVRTLGTQASGIEIPRAEAEQRLTTLWNACRPFVASFEIRGYMAFLRVAIERDAAPDLIKEILNAQIHGIDSTVGYLEALLVSKAQALIAKRDTANLEALFDRTEAIEIHFQTFNWGVLAKAAGKLQDGDILEVIWRRSGASHATFEQIAWIEFSNAAGLVHQGDTLGKAWDEWIVLGDSSNWAVWSSFANATARKGGAVLLEKIWSASEPYRHEFEAPVWGSLAKAAGSVDSEELLWGIWTTCQELGVELNSNALGSFASAAGELAQGTLLEAIWKKLQQSGTALEAKGWGTLAKATQGAKRSDLLRDIFNSWSPQPDSLIQAEHAIWGSFLGAAFGLRDEELGLHMFRRLSAVADPVRLRNWGTLTAPLLTYAAQLKSREAAAEITETLAGFRLDTAHCFNILATSEPSQDYSGIGDKRFEGAARCLMKWLVNSYFYCSVDEFERRLSSLVDSILALKQNQKRAWHALICRGQEAYAACLRTIYFSQYNQYFSHIKDITDQEFVDEIRRGLILKLLGEFRRDVINQMATPQGTLSMAPETSASGLTAVIDLLVSNQENRLRGRNAGDKVTFFEQVMESLEAGGIAAFTRNDWLNFFRILLQTMAKRMWDVLIENSRGRLHDLHNEFEYRFLPTLAGEALIDKERDRLVQTARVLLMDYGRLLGGYRFGELKPINIIPAVWPRLLGGRTNHPKTINEVPRPTFTIAAWDGARDDLLMPLLKELRFNAEKNLSNLNEDEQLYRVSLREGEGREAAYGILTVSNAYRTEGQTAGGTGLGIGLIQRLADALGGFALHSESRGDNGLMMWTWHIYLPLLKEPTK
jgi:hypothetical protein